MSKEKYSFEYFLVSAIAGTLVSIYFFLQNNIFAGGFFALGALVGIIGAVIKYKKNKHEC